MGQVLNFIVLAITLPLKLFYHFSLLFYRILVAFCLLVQIRQLVILTWYVFLFHVGGRMDCVDTLVKQWEEFVQFIISLSFNIRFPSLILCEVHNELSEYFQIITLVMRWNLLELIQDHSSSFSACISSVVVISVTSFLIVASSTNYDIIDNCTPNLFTESFVNFTCNRLSNINFHFKGRNAFGELNVGDKERGFIIGIFTILEELSK